MVQLDSGNKSKPSGILGEHMTPMLITDNQLLIVHRIKKTVGLFCHRKWLNDTQKAELNVFFLQYIGQKLTR